MVRMSLFSRSALRRASRLAFVLSFTVVLLEPARIPGGTLNRLAAPRTTRNCRFASQPVAILPAMEALSPTEADELMALLAVPDPPIPAENLSALELVRKF